MSLDQIVLNFVVNHRNPIITPIMIFFTNIGSGRIVTLGLIVAIIIFCLLKRYFYALILFLSVTFGEAFVQLGKLLFHRQRPPTIYALVSESNFSFPSGHTFTAVSFYLLLFILITYFVKSKNLKILLITIGAIIALLIGTSRIYLGVHWFSDVLLSFALAFIWIRILLNFFKNRLK
jgi:undecaprenyl-diphosphatase